MLATWNILNQRAPTHRTASWAAALSSCTAPPLRGAPCLAGCFTVPVLKFLITFEHGLHIFILESVPFSSVTQSFATLCDPMDCSMPGLPVDHQLPESTQTHVHQVSDAIQPSHPHLHHIPVIPQYLREICCRTTSCPDWDTKICRCSSPLYTMA